MDAGEVNLLIARSGKGTYMLEDGGNGPTDTWAAQMRNNTKRAEVVAAVLHFDGGTGEGADAGGIAACTESELFRWLTFEWM
jgi:hypothetical protein